MKMTREQVIKILKDNKPSTIIFEDEDLQKEIADICKALDMAISALEQISQIRKAIVEAEEENLHLSYPVWCFIRKIEKIVGEKKMGEFKQEPAEYLVDCMVQYIKAHDTPSLIELVIKAIKESEE